MSKILFNDKEVGGTISASLPIGTIIPFASNTTIPNGFLFCNGSELSRAMYPDLFRVIGTTFGAGDGETTFNLPDFTNKFPEGSDIAGTNKNAGLPNIRGQANETFGNAQVYTHNPSGVFGYGSQPITDIYNVSINGTTTTTVGSAGVYLTFDASKSDPIYGGSTTVQPSSLTVKYLIKAFDSITDDPALIDITQYANDLANKANCSLSNLNAAGQASTFPSNTYINIPLSGNGTTYTAPANGYINLAGQSGEANDQMALIIIDSDGTSIAYTQGEQAHVSWGIGLMQPIQKNQTVELHYGNCIVNYHRFIYAQGEVP